jgi:hypothetical protein
VNGFARFTNFFGAPSFSQRAILSPLACVSALALIGYFGMQLIY